jgi:hypothetical protein
LLARNEGSSCEELRLCAVITPAAAVLAPV